MDFVKLSTPKVSKRLDLNLTGTVSKFVSGGKRAIRGVASTDSIDRQGDVVVPSGGQWKLPVPLLWAHSHTDPIGWVRAIEVRGNSLLIEAEIATGIAKADEVWQMVEAGLVTAYSIGFRPLRSEPLRGGGLKFTAWELLEVSAVVVPANQDAKIERNAGAVLLSPRMAGAIKLIDKGDFTCST